MLKQRIVRIGYPVFSCLPVYKNIRCQHTSHQRRVRQRHLVLDDWRSIEEFAVDVFVYRLRNDAVDMRLHANADAAKWHRLCLSYLSVISNVSPSSSAVILSAFSSCGEHECRERAFSSYIISQPLPFDACSPKNIARIFKSFAVARYKMPPDFASVGLQKMVSQDWTFQDIHMATVAGGNIFCKLFHVKNISIGTVGLRLSYEKFFKEIVKRINSAKLVEIHGIIQGLNMLGSASSEFANGLVLVLPSKIKDCRDDGLVMKVLLYVLKHADASAIMASIDYRENWIDKTVSNAIPNISYRECETILRDADKHKCLRHETVCELIHRTQTRGPNLNGTKEGNLETVNPAYHNSLSPWVAQLIRMATSNTREEHIIEQICECISKRRHCEAISEDDACVVFWSLLKLNCLQIAGARETADFCFNICLKNAKANSSGVHRGAMGASLFIYFAEWLHSKEADVDNIINAFFCLTCIICDQDYINRSNELFDSLFFGFHLIRMRGHENTHVFLKQFRRIDLQVN